MKVNTKVNCIIVDGEILDFNKPKYEITNNFDNFYYKSIIDFFSGKYKKGFYSKYRLVRIFEFSNRKSTKRNRKI